MGRQQQELLRLQHAAQQLMRRLAAEFAWSRVEWLVRKEPGTHEGAVIDRIEAPATAVGAHLLGGVRGFF